MIGEKDLIKCLRKVLTITKPFSAECERFFVKTVGNNGLVVKTSNENKNFQADFRFELDETDQGYSSVRFCTGDKQVLESLLGNPTTEIVDMTIDPDTQNVSMIEFGIKSNKSSARIRYPLANLESPLLPKPMKLMRPNESLVLSKDAAKEAKNIIEIYRTEKTVAIDLTQEGILNIKAGGMVDNEYPALMSIEALEGDLKKSIENVKVDRKLFLNSLLATDSDIVIIGTGDRTVTTTHLLDDGLIVDFYMAKLIGD